MISDPRQDPQMSPSDCAEHLKEKHLQMVMNAKQFGRDIKAVPVSIEAVGEEVARTAVEASQRTMKRSERRSFLIPGLPWQRSKS